MAPTLTGVSGFAVEVEDLHVRFGTVRAVDGVSVQFPAAGVCAVLGPNGAGKTTLIETCEGYRRPHRGRVRVLGRDPVADARELRPRVGVMLQEGGVWPALAAGPALHRVARFYRDPLPVDSLMERLGLSRLGGRTFRRMSGGEKQRVKLAAAIIGRPELVFLDEPTAGMDPQARLAVWDLIRQLRDDGVSVVLTTHLMDEAEQLADEVVIVDRGRVVATGSPSGLTSRYDEVLTFRASAGLDTALLQAALPDGCVVVEDPPGSYRVEGTVDPALLAAVAAWCAEHGVLATALTTGRRSLEDVFLDLTGRALR